jgi:hypothetical protein
MYSGWYPEQQPIEMAMVPQFWSQNLVFAGGNQSRKMTTFRLSGGHNSCAVFGPPSS